MELLNRTLFTLNAEAVTALRLLWAVLAFALVMAIAHLGSGLLRRRLFARGHGNPPTEKSLLRVCRALAGLAGLVLALRIVGFGLTGLLLFCGLLALALALVARGVLANYVAGIVLLYERPVSVGDHIRIGAETGEVEAIRLRVTHVRTPGNTRVIVPNSLLMREAITNFSAPDGRMRLCIGVQVAHGSDSNDVIMTLRKVAERNPRVRKNPAPRSLMTGVVPDGLQFELWAWIGDPADAPWVENEIYRGIDSEFQKLRIRLSGPHVASPPSSVRRPATDEFTPSPRMQVQPASAQPPATEETARLRTSKWSDRRPKAEANAQAREDRQVREEAPAVRVPPPPAPETPVAEQADEPESRPKSGRTRARTRRGQETPPPPPSGRLTQLARRVRPSPRNKRRSTVGIRPLRNSRCSNSPNFPLTGRPRRSRRPRPRTKRPTPSRPGPK